MSSPVAQVRTRMPRIAELPSRLAGSHLRTGALERARLTVVPRRRTRAARMPFVALVSMVLLSGVVGLLLFNTSMQQASFAATALEEQANTLAARQQSLQLDLDRLRNPQRIASAAQKLGMVPAGNPAFLELGTGKVVGVPSAGDGSTPFRIWPRPERKPAAIDPETTVVEVPASAAHESAGDGRGDRANQHRADKNHGNHQQQTSHQNQH